MPNLRPTTRIDVIGNLDLNPEKATGFFLESKQQKKFLIKPPKWDTAGESIELLAIQNEREHQEMLRLQEEMLKNAKLQSEINSKRVQELFQLNSNLKNRFAQVNRFMKECDEKKRVAEAKAVKELEKQEELKESIKKYKEDIKVLTEFRDILSEAVNDFEPYEVVINEVISKTDTWTSVRDCTDRCDALILGQQEIAETEKQKIREMEEKRAEMVKLSSEASLIVLGYMNELTELEKDYNEAREQCLKWEKVLANIKHTVSEEKLTKKRMIDGIHLMYRLLCKRRGMHPRIKPKYIDRQLDFIMSEIDILEKVIEECEKN